jgi:hypothetical protein
MAPTGAQAVGALSGTYYGTLEDRNPGTKLPPRLMVNLVAAAAAGAEDGLKVTGSVRLYFGGFDTAEYLELPIESVDHRFYTRRLVLRTGGHPRLTLTASLSKEGTLTGSVSEDTFGEVGPFTVTAAAPQDGGGALGGTYEGWFEWRGLESWQHGSLVLTPTFDGPDAMTLRGTTSLVFGDPTGDERLVYAAVDAAFDAATGQAVFGDQDAEVTLRGSLGDGMFEGEWTTARTGEMGRFRLKLGGGLPPPSGLGLLTSLEGKFQGSLVNTSPDANLPERVMLGFVTSPDLTAPSGLKVEGSLRLYLGPFGSNEYTELPLTEIQYDVFNRKLSARTTGDLIVTLKADVGARSITGELFSGSLGKIANFEVTATP